MEPATLLGLIVVAPLTLIILFKSDAAIIFLSLCVGSLLVQVLGNDAASAASQNTDISNAASMAQIGLLLTPALLSLIMLRHSVSAARMPLNILTAVAVGLVLPLLLVPLLPGGVQYNITSSSLWIQTEQYQKLVVGASAVVALLSLWLGHKGKGKHHKKRH